MPAPARRRRPAPVVEQPLEARPGETVVWTDGACRRNPGPGGWAAIVVPGDGGDRVELSGGEPHTTNNRMEYSAAIEGLRSLPDASTVCIVTDSSLMLDSMTKWLEGWKRRGWKTSGGKPVKNRDLVEALEAQIDRHAVRWHWVRGHEYDATDPAYAHKEPNDRADQLAVAEAARF